MSKVYRELNLDDPRQILQILMKSSDIWLGEDFMFRGIKDTSYALIPSAWRDTPNIKNIFAGCKIKILKTFNDNNYIDEFLSVYVGKFTEEEKESSRIKDYVWQITSELYLTHEFTKRSNIVGLQISDPNPFGRISVTQDFIDIQHDILFGKQQTGVLKSILGNSEKIKSIKALLTDGTEPLTNFIPSTYTSERYFSTYALAQHHGIPTRFLDWTHNPLKALYFAICDSGDNDVAVIALHKQILNRHGVSISEDFPHHKFTFLHKQEGAFTYLRNADAWYLKNGKWPSIEDLLSAQNLDMEPLVKLIIKSSLKPELLRLLELEGITRESLMPTYDYVAKSVKSNMTE